MSTGNSEFVLLPCSDSPAMADTRSRELRIPRDRAASLGREAVEACERGWYIDSRGKRVDWQPLVQAAITGKTSIPPDDALPENHAPPLPETRIQVGNETTLGASRRLVERSLRPLALNFANGVHPGGGFLGGARAQEEVLCRSSALFPTLVGDAMYEAHARRPLPDSSNWVIHSPDVPVFRNDDGTPLHDPWLLGFLTCAAPYAPAIGQPASGDLLQQRIHRVLAVARALHYTTLVLGAWGCGAFANDPERTARDFHSALESEFRGAFSEIVFAVTDWSPDRRTLGPFCEVFS